MRINTKVIFDIESGQILHREAYEYCGPLELCTNVTAAVPNTTPGAYWVEVRTSGTPGVGAIDMKAGGQGARVEPNGAVEMFSMPLGGHMGVTTLGDGSLVMAIFAPATWEDFWPGIQDTPAVPTIFTQSLTGALSFTGTLTDAVIFGETLTGVLSFAGTLARKTSHLLAGVLSFARGLDAQNIHSSYRSIELHRHIGHARHFHRSDGRDTIVYRQPRRQDQRHPGRRVIFPGHLNHGVHSRPAGRRRPHPAATFMVQANAAIKLTELQPQFVRYESKIETYKVVEGDQATWHERGCPTKEVTGPRHYMASVSTFVEAQGIHFLCPKCFAANRGDVGTHWCQVTFEGKGVPPEMGCHDNTGRPTRWNVSGSGYGDLTVTPSIQILGGCAWHGFITNGEILS